MEEKKVLLSIHDLEVKFRVRGRILTAIRGVSLDIYENESIAIVGESGSGKSVFTKTFAGMLDSNGFISNGSIVFSDPELADTSVNMKASDWNWVRFAHKELNAYSKLELGASIYRQMLELDAQKKEKLTLSEEEQKQWDAKIADLNFRKVEASNLKLTIDPKEKARIKELSAQIADMEKQIKELEVQKAALIKSHANAARQDSAWQAEFAARKAELKAEYAKAIGADYYASDAMAAVRYAEGAGVCGADQNTHNN